VKESIPSSEASAQSEENHDSIRLTPSRRIGWRRRLARSGFALFFITLVGHSLLMCDCGAVPGVIMAASALLPLVFGSRLQRIAAGLCLAFAVYLAYSGFQSTRAMRERIERVQQLHEQQLRAQ
jgi:hypothetical protein